MALVIVKDKVSEDDFEGAKEDYGTYIKITLDIEKRVVALGGEYHADAEQLLLAQGARQKDIWGGGLNLEEGRIETNAIINLRPRQNQSTEILDGEVRKEFIEIVKKVLKGYVK